MKWRRGSRGKWLFAGWVLAFFGAMIGLAWWTFGMASERELAHQIRDAKAEGLLVDVKDLYRNPPLAAKDDAGPIYLKAADQATKFKFEFRDLNWLYGEVVYGRATSAEKRDAEKELATVNPTLALLKEAAEKPDCDFHRHWEDGPNLILPDLAQLKGLAKVVCLRAILAAEKGDFDGALDDLKVAALMSRHVASQPSFLEWLVSDSIFLTWEFSFERAIAVGHVTRAAARKIGGLSSIVSDYLPLRKSLRAELPSCRATLEWLTTTDDSQFDGLRQLARVSTVRRRAHIRLISLWRRAMGALVLERVDYDRTQQALRKLIDETSEPLDVVSKLTFMFPNLNTFYLTKAMSEVRRRSLLNVAAIFDTWGRTGVWPSKLPDLGLDSVDPFSGKPLGYHRTAMGFIVYSVGKDRVDDNGRKRDLTDSTGTYDIAFEYPAPVVASTYAPPRPGHPTSSVTTVPGGPAVVK